MNQSACTSTGLPIRGVTTRSPTLASIQVSWTPGTPARSSPSRSAPIPNLVPRLYPSRIASHATRSTRSAILLSRLDAFEASRKSCVATMYHSDASTELYSGVSPQQLKQVVRNHVAQRAGRLVERAAFLHTDSFRRRDLDVGDVFPAPGRLEQTVGKTERHHALHRLLAEVMVDAEDLIFAEHGVDLVVQLARALQIDAKRLLDDDASELALGLTEKPGAAKPASCRPPSL